MKKVLIIVAISLVLTSGISFGIFKFLDNQQIESSAEEPEVNEQDERVLAPIDEEESEEQTRFIGGIQYDTGLSPDSSLSSVMDVMHKMTHQKIRAEDKWGAIPMTEDTINQVYEVVSNSDFDIKNDLLDILERWRKGDFSQADHDHNYIWNWQGGTIGKAYGLMTPEEEIEFIENNFKDYIVTDKDNKEE
ncbi:PRK06770 family protein [Geobacillus phage GR1]|nr:PRK06770 family protein [Geobacillus phage GR1]